MGKGKIDVTFPGGGNPNISLHTTTRCKRNINYQQYKNSHSNLFIFGQIYVLITRCGKEEGEEYRAPLSLHTTRKVAQKDPIFPP